MIARAALLYLAAILLWSIGGAAPAAVAQEDGEPRLRVESVNSDSFPAVEAVATVLDPDGVPISGLAPDAFSIAGDGDAAVPVTGVASTEDAEIGISVVLAFDVSGSMGGPPLDTAKAAGISLIQQLGPNDRVAVLSFAQTVEVVQPFTSDRAALDAAINGLASVGGTALYEGVARSAELAAGAETPRRAVVLLSDGTDYGELSVATREGSVAAAGGSGAPFYVVGLGEQIDDEYLEQLASATRGELLVAPTIESLEGLYVTIGAALRQQYVITFDASSLAGATDVSLRLEVAAGGATAVAELAFTPPAPPPPPVTAPPVQEPEPVQPEPEPEPPVVVPEPVAESGGVSPIVIIAVASGGLGVVLVAFLLWRRRRRGKRTDPAELAYRAIRDRVQPKPVTNGGGEETATLREKKQAPAPAAFITVGPGDGGRHAVDGAPVTIGFSSDCDIVLPGSGSRGAARVRIFRRDGRFMLHNLSRAAEVSVGGKPASWLILEDGDAINIGGCEVIFESQ